MSHSPLLYSSFFFFFFNDTATTEIYTLSLHDALPICSNYEPPEGACFSYRTLYTALKEFETDLRSEEHTSELQSRGHLVCRLLLEKKKKKKTNNRCTYNQNICNIHS